MIGPSASLKCLGNLSSRRPPFDNGSLHALSQSVALRLSRIMGVLSAVAGPLGNFTADSSLPVLIASGFASFLLLAVVLNVLKQLLLKKPNEPPMVFHWLPIIGSTVTYGMDPFAFFFKNQKKVCSMANAKAAHC